MLPRLNKKLMRSLISKHTKQSRDHLTPELLLHLITPECHLWRARPEDSPFSDPFWAFYWPGGQALTRFILDNKATFHKRRVLDVGSGCGSASIACALSGASLAVANDIDPVASLALEMNIESNATLTSTITSDTKNYLTPDSRQNDKSDQPFDVILMGDMFYDPDFAQDISRWLTSLGSKTTVFIGDPGRLSFMQHPLKHRLKRVAKFDLGSISKLENNGLTEASVWMFRNIR